MKSLSMVFVLLMNTTAVYSQQIVSPENQPLNLRTDANNVNLFIGQNPMTTNGGSANTLVGYKAGQAITSSAENTLVGYQAGLNSTGGSNLFLGAYAGYSSLNSNASFNTFIGQRTGYNTTSGFANIFLGSNAGYSNQSGNYNTFIGNSAGQQSQFGSFNTFIGNGAGYNSSTANYNLFMGAQAGYYTITGNYNVILGQDAGLNNRGANNSTFIGKGSGPDQNHPNLENATAIGANTIVSADNTLVLGNNVKVGIGTSTPSAKLEIVSGVSGSSGLRLTNIGTSATLLNQTKFLTVNGQGDVVIGSTNGSARLPADASSLWQMDGNNIYSINTGGVVIGTGLQKTPEGYNLYVSKGILTEKIKVALQSTDDWSDHVFSSSYRLKNLKVVEAYIKKNKHLPGIPSANSLVHSGVDIIEMDAKLLEKIEELTLYTIKLEKISHNQQKEIDELKKLMRQRIKKK